MSKQNTPETRKKNNGGEESARGWTSRLSALASQAGDTVRHIPDKAVAMEHRLGERVSGIVSGAGTLQEKMVRIFPTLNGSKVDDREVIEAGLSRLKLLAKVMDDLVEIPVLNKTIGLDPVLGMIPVVGRLLPPGISAYALIEAGHIGAPPSLLLKMLGRHVVDYVGSHLPLVGPLFDAMYKAHRLNLQELISYFETELGELDVAGVEH